MESAGRISSTPPTKLLLLQATSMRTAHQSRNHPSPSRGLPCHHSSNTISTVGTAIRRPRCSKPLPRHPTARTPLTPFLRLKVVKAGRISTLSHAGFLIRPRHIPPRIPRSTALPARAFQG
ncbi:hypothetical protein BN1723_018098 [Verticillium longisporum]|uniref:Uncharacterized protein n=1 Tax=Verticillium longisporum TaxID=100787 RepID=A0A0G4LNW8_VERLO|nr:hypothetical protein BN1723_018098 [Verticillium longisporum]